MILLLQSSTLTHAGSTSILQENSRSSLKDEIAALKLLRGGPHIIRLLDVFEEPNSTYMVMEECKGGDLLDRVTEKEVYTEREARRTCKYLFEAMDYIHKKKSKLSTFPKIAFHEH